MLQSYAYTLGPDGNRTRVVESSGRTVDYEYDALLRLTRETTPQGTTAYTYDAASNRATRTDASGTLAYTGDPNNRLLSADATNYAYDNNGNLLSQTDATVPRRTPGMAPIA